MWNAVAGENKLQRASLVQCSKLQIVTFTLRMEMPWHAIRERSAWCVYVTLARQPHQEWLISTGAFLSERMDVWLEDRPPHIRRTRSLKPTKLVVVCAFIIHRSSYIYSSPCLLLLVLRAHADRYSGWMECSAIHSWRGCVWIYFEEKKNCQSRVLE